MKHLNKKIFPNFHQLVYLLVTMRPEGIPLMKDVTIFLG